MCSALEIRQAVRKDAGRVAEIEKSIFSDAWSREEYENLFMSPAMHFYVAVFEGDIAGYAGYTSAADEADIIDIGVVKKLQGQGIGSSLLACILDELQGKRVFLEVRKSNAPAIALYKKFEFVQVGTRKNYYDNPKEDAIIMFSDRKEVINA